MKQGNFFRHAMTACHNDRHCSYHHPPRDAYLAAAGLVQDGDDFRLLVNLNARFAAGERQSEDVWIGINTELGRACFQCLSAIAPDKNISISQIAWVEQYARFYVIVKINGKEKKIYKRLHSPFVTHYLEHKKSRLPKVSGLMTMPLVLPNGKLLARHGLNRKLKTVFCIEPEIVDLVPQGEISDGDIAAAMKFLTDDWLADVQTDYDGKCTLIALALSVIERHLFGERPTFSITAGKRGTGKTTACTMIALALLARRPAAAAWSPNEEERRKAIFAALLQGLPFIVWDNIRRGTAISCPTIEKASTGAELEDRVLKESRWERVAATAIMVFTGNNITTKGDLASRNLSIRLTTDRPDPENRDFAHSDPFIWTLDHRGEIITALYTILLGNPRFKQRLKDRAPAKTRFKQWWHLVGAPIEYAAELAKGARVDFGELFLSTEAEDEEGVDLAEALLILEKRSGLVAFRASEVVNWLYDGTDDAMTLKHFFGAIEIEEKRKAAKLSTKVLANRLKEVVDAPVFVDNDTAVLTLCREYNTHDKVWDFKVSRTWKDDIDPPF